MTELKTNASLKKYNTFGIEAIAKYFCFYENIDDLVYLQKNGFINKKIPIIVLGGGSNLLFVKPFEGLIIYPINKAITIEQETENEVFIKVEAGKNWDEFVSYAVQKGYGGVENLSGIPGNVGATPVQNIGAYGVEVCEVIDRVNVIDLFTSKKQTFFNSDCEFGYRSSIFKNKDKNRFLVDSVIFKLSKTPIFKTHYGSIREELEKHNELNLQSIRASVLSIRNKKLPDPLQIGNAGSFFKNPIIKRQELASLLKKYPQIVYYELSNNEVKVAAAWLIEQAGLKGYENKKKSAGVHQNQALVLINKGTATGKDIVELANFVRDTVFEKFGIFLEPEVIQI